MIDTCLPVQLKVHLRFEEVRTARELGWQDKKNGALLALAQQQFDVVLTMDKGMPDQQFLKRFFIAVIILRARSKRLADVLPLVPALQMVVPRARKGEAVAVSEPK